MKLVAKCWKFTVHLALGPLTLRHSSVFICRQGRFLMNVLLSTLIVKSIIGFLLVIKSLCYQNILPCRSKARSKPGFFHKILHTYFNAISKIFLFNYDNFTNYFLVTCLIKINCSLFSATL